MLDKRKALIGYAVYTAGKPLAMRALRQKASAAAPEKKRGRLAVGALGLLAAAGAAGGILLFARRRSGGGPPPGA